MIQRPILVAVIGYIIGILWGLYLQISIVPFYILITVIYFFIKILKLNRKKKFKLLSFSRYSKYFKLIINSKVIFIIIIFSIISNTIIYHQNNQYKNTYEDGKTIEITGIIVSQKIEKQYYNLYKVKILDSKFNIYIQTVKTIKTLEYGDKVKIKGEFTKPSVQRNYKGYNDSNYLKTLKIIGRMKVNEINVESKNQINIFYRFANQINLKIKENIDKSLDSKNAAILKGLLLGDKQDIEEDVKQDFQISNMSHILAISGMHIGYLIIGLQLLLKNIIGKKKIKIVTIIILIQYVFITGFSPSVVRASIMSILVIGAELLNRKSDIWNCIAISLFVILIYNPFLILNIGLQLSYLGTIGIILFNPTITKLLSTIKLKKENKIIEKIKKILSVTISAQIMIMPILLYNFNIIGIYFLITNLLVSIIIGPIIILSFLCVILSLFFSQIIKIFSPILNILIGTLSIISKFSNLPFAKIYIPTPQIYIIILYLIFIVIAKYIYEIYTSRHLNMTRKKSKKYNCFN